MGEVSEESLSTNGEVVGEDDRLQAFLRTLLTRPGNSMSLEELFKHIGVLFPDRFIQPVNDRYRARLRLQWDEDEPTEPIEPLPVKHGSAEYDEPETFTTIMQFAADICEEDILVRVDGEEFVISPTPIEQPAEIT